MRRQIFRAIGGILGLFLLIVSAWIAMDLNEVAFLDIVAILTGLVVGALLVRYSLTGISRFTRPRYKGGPNA
jgi:hypothetical protein